MAISVIGDVIIVCDQSPGSHGASATALEQCEPVFAIVSGDLDPSIGVADVDIDSILARSDRIESCDDRQHWNSGCDRNTHAHGISSLNDRD